MTYYLVNSIAIIFIAYWGYKKLYNPDLMPFYLPALGVKLLAGVGVGLVFKYYYQSGDTWATFDNAIQAGILFSKDPAGYFQFLWYSEYTGTDLGYVNQPRALFFVKIISVFVLLTHNNYWLTSVYLSVFSFLGVWYFATLFYRYFPRSKKAIVVALLLFPSIVFWSSGVNKETIAMLSIMIISAYTLVFLFDREQITVPKILFSLILFWLLLQLKYYYAGVFLVAVASLLLSHFADQKWGRMSGYVSWFTAFILLIFLASFIHPNLHINHVLDVMVLNHNLYQEYSGKEGMILFYNLSPNIGSIIINAPWAIISAWYRPFLTESHTIFQLVIALENLFMLGLSVNAIRNIRRKKTQYPLLLLSCASYIIVLSVFLAISTPNFGTLSRYRISFLPFLLLLLMLGNKRPSKKLSPSDQ